MSSAHNILSVLGQGAAAAPAGTDLSLANLDVTVRTLAATSGVLGGQSIVFPINALTVNTFVWVNNTSFSITMAGIAVVYDVVSTSGTLDIRKIAVGVNAPTTGVSLVTGTVNLATTARTLITPTLTATLADRIVAPSEKVAFVIGGTMTGLSGGTVTLLF